MTKLCCRSILASLCIAGALSSTGLAQSGQTVFDRVRDAILAQEVGWQLESSDIDDHQCSQDWVNRAERISIVYDERSSIADATSWLNEFPSRVSSGGGEAAEGVGDEALIYARM